MKILMALVLLLGVFQAGGAVHAAEMAGHGFVLAEVGTIDIIGADTYLYVHERTGARVFHIANDDSNRAMVVAFETPTHDDMGTPHVVEHMVIQGSERFPSANLFFSLIYQTYATFVNAMVFNSGTVYMYASMSEEQLLLMADYLMDSALFPLFPNEPLLFAREAWRHEIDDEGQLNVTGVVYNEARGFQSSIERNAYMNLIRALFPGTVSANDAGGIPEELLNLTFEDTVAFHEEYYHPSNMIVFLYGNLDAEPFLELIGSFCDRFEHREIFVDKGEAVPFDAPVTAVVPFPVEITGLAENNSIINYGIHLGQLEIQEFVSFSILASVLGVEPSPLMQNLRAVLPGGTFGVGLANETAGDFLLITGAGLNEDDMDVFRDTIHQSALEIAENGFEQELLEAIIAAFEFSILALTENADMGISMSTDLAWLYSLGFGFDYYNQLVAGIERVKEQAHDGYFEALIAEFLLDNPHRALVATVPAPGLREEMDAELRAYLDRHLAAMTDAEITELMAQSELVEIMSNTPPPEWMIESLNAVTVDTLPVEVRNFDINESDFGGARIFTAEASVGGIYFATVDFNSAAVTLDELHYLNLYSRLLGQVRTENYELAELQTRMFRYLNGFSALAGAREFYDNRLQPALTIDWMGLNDDFPEAAALAAEIVRYTDVTDLETILSIVRRLEFSERSSINGNPLNLLLHRAEANHFDRSAYISHVRGLAFFEFLSYAADQIENDPDTFIANLTSARGRLGYLEDSAAFFIGNAEGIEIFEENVELILGHLREGPVPAADLSDIPRPEGNEGIILDTAVQFNVAFAAMDDIGIEYSGTLLPLADIITEGYLNPEVRFNIGAYGVFMNVLQTGIAIASFWDPAVAETFAAYAAIADFAEDSGLSQSDIDRFIISVFAGRTRPAGELSQAFDALLPIYLGFPEDSRETLLAEIKAVTLEDLEALAGPLALATEMSVLITAGSRSAIYANAELFDTIIYAFGAPGDEPAGMTRFELLAQIFGTDDEAIYDMAVEMGLMPDIGEPSDPLTREEFAFVLIMASGGPELFVDEEIDIADADDISEWAYQAIIAALYYEVFTLDEDGRFNPQDAVTLEEFWAALQ